MPEWIVALLGVVTGFALNEASSFVQSKRKSKSYKRALFDELEGNLYQLNQKKDIIEQVLLALAQNGMLGAESVPFSDAAYVSYFPEIMTEFTTLERDNIRHIYSSLKTLDSITASLERDFKEDQKAEIFVDIHAAYSLRVDDIFQMYHRIEGILEAFLQKQPIDIYGRNPETT